MKITLFLLLILFGWCLNGVAQPPVSTYVYSGSIQSYTVPSGVISLNIDARGGNGGYGIYGPGYSYGGIGSSSGGYGGRVVCSLAVTPGQILYVSVGGHGDSSNTFMLFGIPCSGGWNGGANGSNGGAWYPNGGGGGGGGTDIRTGGTAISNREVVAGGGGGAGYDCGTFNYQKGGDGGGLTAGDGHSCNIYDAAYSGGGGTQIAGGTGGISILYGPGGNGGIDTGGRGPLTMSGGGGGGGYFGGGGGIFGGGGGGSSYTDPLLATGVIHTSGYNTTGADSVIIVVVCWGGLISGNPAVCIGNTTALSDTVGSGAGTWTSSNTGIATVGSSTGVVTGISPGTATVTYSVMSYCGYMVSSSVTVTVNPYPATIIGTKTVCPGYTTLLSDALTGGTWTSSNTAITTIGSSTGVVSGISPGTATITYSAGIGAVCSVMTTVTVNPTPPAITGLTGVCAGATTILSDGISGGTWSSTNTSVATIGSSTGTVTGITAGTTAITYTLPTGCINFVTVTVNPLPSGISGATSVCPGLTVTLSDITPGGTWSSSNTTVATVGSSTGIVTGITTGTSLISYTLATGCSSFITVTVNALPSVITGAAILCIATTGTLSDATAGGMWTSSTTVVASIGYTTGLVTGISAGTSTITYTVLPSGCFITTTVTINALPGAITGSTNLCVGLNSALSDASGGGTWSSSNTTIVTIGSGTGITTGISTGTATITYSSGAGCIVTKMVTVNPLSVITGSSSICAGASATLSDATAGGTWSSGATLIATVGSGSGIVTGVATGTSTISYVLPTGCIMTTTILVTPPPAAITGTFTICTGYTATLSDAIPGGYWTSSNTSVAMVGSSSGIVTGLAAGTLTISYSTGPGCSATRVIIVNLSPSPVTGVSTVCAGATATLSDASSGGGWSSSNTSIASVGIISGIVTGISPGTATITYTTGCIAIITVTVVPTPLPVTGLTNICISSGTTLSDPSPGGAWSSSNTAVAVIGTSSGILSSVTPGTSTITYSTGIGCTATTIVTVNPSPSIITGTGNVCNGYSTTLSDAGGGTWTSSNTTITTAGLLTGIVNGVAIGTATISYTLGTGCSTTRMITVNPMPAAITGASVVCAGSTVLLSDPGGGTWSSSNTVNVTVGVSSGIVTGMMAGTATIIYSLGTGCTTTAAILVNPLPPAITGAGKVCAGSFISLSDPLGGGAWSSSNTVVATADFAGNVTGISAGTVTISYLLSGCPAVAMVTVNSSPGPITGSTDICLGTSVTLSDAGGGTWSSIYPTVSVGATTGIVSGIATGTAIITYKLANGCIAATVTTVVPLPSIISGPGTVCGGDSITLSDATTGGTWSSGNTAIAVVASGIVTGIKSGVVMITYATGTACLAAKTLTVYPAVAPITGASDMCAGGESMYVYDADTPYGSWTSTFVTITTGGLVKDYDPGVGIITYTLPTGCSATVTITVNPLPDMITGANILCAGSSTLLSDTTSGGTWSSAYGSIATVSGTGLVSGIAAGTTTITYMLPTGCLVADTITVDKSPSAITGTSDVCVGSSATLVDTVSGGTWTSSGGIATVGMSTGIVTGLAIGTTAITYTADGCLATKTVTVSGLPNIYGLLGGGSFCSGGIGVHVLLSGSDPGIRYKLYNGIVVTDSMNGTGGLLDFGTETSAGTYTAAAANMTTGCSSNMSDSAVIIIDPAVAPSATISAVPGDTVCSGTLVAFTVTPANGGTVPVYQWKVNGINTGTGSTSYSYTPVDGDAVIVMMTSNAPCASPLLTDTFVIMSVIDPIAPTAIVTADPGTGIAKGENVTFTAVVTNGVPDITYQWLLNGITLPGATNATYTNNNFADYDKISCMVTSTVGTCTATSATPFVQMIVNTDCVKSLPSAVALKVIPNPSKGDFLLCGTLGSMNDNEVSLEITDMLGRMIFKEKILAKNGSVNEQIQLRNSPSSGMYLLNVRSDAGSEVFHLVIE